MEVYLDGLTLKDCEQVRLWRNEVPAALRTAHPLTAVQQETFYRETVCNEWSRHRYRAIRHGDPKWRYDGDILIGMGGLTSVDYENGRTEISLILGPAFVGKGYGRAAVKRLLALAFDHLRLEVVTGECYDCNPAVAFWRKIVAEHNGTWVTLPRLKFWDGKRWDSHFFMMEKSIQERVNNTSKWLNDAPKTSPKEMNKRRMDEVPPVSREKEREWRARWLREKRLSNELGWGWR